MPNVLTYIVFGLLAFGLAASSDWLETRYVNAVHDWRKGDESAPERAARASVAMWFVGVVALMTVLEVGWWTLLPEGAGLYVGTRLALRKTRTVRAPASGSSPTEEAAPATKVVAG